MHIRVKSEWEKKIIIVFDGEGIVKFEVITFSHNKKRWGFILDCYYKKEYWKNYKMFILVFKLSNLKNKNYILFLGN